MICKDQKQNWRKTMILKVKKQNWRENYFMESQETELKKKNYDMKSQETELDVELCYRRKLKGKHPVLDTRISVFCPLFFVTLRLPPLDS